MNPDLINAAFQMLYTVLIINHCRVTLKHQDSKGVSIFSCFLFTIGGAWSVYYLVTLQQWYSMISSIALLIANGTWVGMMIYFRNKNDRRNKIQNT